MRSKIETQILIIVVTAMLLQALVVASITWAEDITGLGAMILYALGCLLIVCVLIVMIIQGKDRILDACYDYYNESIFELYNQQQKQNPGEKDGQEIN
jgi:hypothetical protein